MRRDLSRLKWHSRGAVPNKSPKQLRFFIHHNDYTFIWQGIRPEPINFAGHVTHCYRH